QAVENFLGCGPDDDPQRFRWADPLHQVPLAVPVYAFHSGSDDAVPVALSENYVAAAQSAGGRAELVRVPGDHSDIIDPGSAAFEQIRTVLEGLD
ncbi:MAG TPA: alpha/beta hydrolase, partial [Arthrobacter sp.]|nr:alpha/beta hydrolase [Arthrobacter sp.]